MLTLIFKTAFTISFIKTNKQKKLKGKPSARAERERERERGA